MITYVCIACNKKCKVIVADKNYHSKCHLSRNIKPIWEVQNVKKDDTTQV